MKHGDVLQRNELFRSLLTRHGSSVVEVIQPTLLY